MPQRNSDIPVQPGDAGPNAVPSNGEQSIASLPNTFYVLTFSVIEPGASCHWL